MRIDWTFLRSRVARRLFTLFLLCALVPITLLGGVALLNVTGELREQGRARLQSLSVTHGMSLAERVLVIAELLQAGAGPLGGPVGSGVPSDGEEERFRRIVRTAPDLAPGSDPHRGPVSLSSEERDQLRRTGLVLRVVPTRDETLAFVGVTDPLDAHAEVIWGQVEPSYLWWGISRQSTLSGGQQIHVFDAQYRLAFSSASARLELPADLGHGGNFSWQLGGEEQLAGYWTLPPRLGSLVLVISEPTADILDAVAEFKQRFLLILLAAIWIVALASVSQIRRSLTPLEQLQEGTRRIASRDFDTAVEIKSGDEFEELGESFNAMARTLGQQFGTLTTLNEIGQAVLSALAIEGIVDSALSRLGEVLPCDALAVTVFGADLEGPASTHYRLARRGAVVGIQEVRPDREDLRRLEQGGPYLVLPADRLPAYLAPLAGRSVAGLIVFPISIRGELAAVIALLQFEPRPTSPEDLERARQLADQIGLALSNARLVGELDQLSRGTLTALARAVDTKSSWTAGHSERVAALGQRLGGVMGYSAEEQEVLHRGGLLHDIGKIGVPNAILDKPARLTPEERRVMESHVELGARILEPIPGFEPMLPIVWEHHEWINGLGYPRKLTGEQMTMKGKIFGVADVFDALRSARPYRPELDLERVFSIMREETGTHLDPSVMEALLGLERELREGYARRLLA